MALQLKLSQDLLWSRPPFWTERKGLTKVLDGWRHGGFLEMSQLAGAVMGMVHQQVLEEDRIMDGQEFHGNEEFVST